MNKLLSSKLIVSKEESLSQKHLVFQLSKKRWQKWRHYSGHQDRFSPNISNQIIFLREILDKKVELTLIVIQSGNTK